MQSNRCFHYTQVWTHMTAGYINFFYYKFSHYFGTAFRYKKFQAGLEYNIAKTEYLIGERDEYNSPMIAKYNMNNFRMFLGLKF